MKVAIIGSGSGAQAFSCDFASRGHSVTVWSKNIERIEALHSKQNLVNEYYENATTAKVTITNRIADAVQNAEVIMFITNANLHASLFEYIYPYLHESQLLVLSPGKTLGLSTLKFIEQRIYKNKDLAIIELQTLLFACREIEPGNVQILGRKKYIEGCFNSISSLEKWRGIILELIPEINLNVGTLSVSVNNIAPILHPPIMLANVTRITQGLSFKFYRDISQEVANLMLDLDSERMAIADFYQADYRSLSDWITSAYDLPKQDSLLRSISNNLAYTDVISPQKFNSRFLTEDIPTGLIPLERMAALADIEVPSISSVINMAGSMLQRNFYTEANPRLEYLNSFKNPKELVKSSNENFL